MLQQILNTFFIGQVVVEAIYEHTFKQWQLEFEQFNEKLKKEKRKYASSNGNHHAEAVFEETKKDCEEIVALTQRVLSNSVVLAQEYSQQLLTQTFGTVTKVTESAMEATKLPLLYSGKTSERPTSKTRA